MVRPGPHREGEEPKPMMHERGKSDSAVRAVKPANKAERSAAEVVEQRAGTKGNADQQSTRRAQERESVSQALGRIADEFKAKVEALASGARSTGHVTHAELAQQFGASPSDMEAVVNFAKQHHLPVVQ